MAHDGWRWFTALAAVAVACAACGSQPRSNPTAALTVALPVQELELPAGGVAALQVALGTSRPETWAFEPLAGGSSLRGEVISVMGGRGAVLMVHVSGDARPGVHDALLRARAGGREALARLRVRVDACSAYLPPSRQPSRGADAARTVARASR